MKKKLCYLSMISFLYTQKKSIRVWVSDRKKNLVQQAHHLRTLRIISFLTKLWLTLHLHILHMQTPYTCRYHNDFTLANTPSKLNKYIKWKRRYILYDIWIVSFFILKKKVCENDRKKQYQIKQNQHLRTLNLISFLTELLQTLYL